MINKCCCQFKYGESQWSIWSWLGEWLSYASKRTCRRHFQFRHLPLSEGVRKQIQRKSKKETLHLSEFTAADFHFDSPAVSSKEGPYLQCVRHRGQNFLSAFDYWEKNVREIFTEGERLSVLFHWTVANLSWWYTAGRSFWIHQSRHCFTRSSIEIFFGSIKYAYYPCTEIYWFQTYLDHKIFRAMLLGQLSRGCNSIPGLWTFTTSDQSSCIWLTLSSH